MTFKLGDLVSNTESLKKLKESLLPDRQTVPQDSERWERLSAIAGRIEESCQCQDLEMLVSSVRDMKNRLRRPSIRKDLARLEANEGNGRPAKPDGNPTGKCNCAECGKKIDGSIEPCVKGALCTDCALKNKVVSKKDQEQARKPKAANPIDSMALTGMAASTMGAEQGPEQGGEPKESVGLRRRGYVI